MMDGTWKGGLAGGLALLAAAARAQSPADDITANCSRMNSAGREFNRGYSAARVEVKSTAALAARAVELRVQGYGEVQLVRRLRLAPGAVEHVHWNAPLLQYGGLEVWADGERKQMNPLPLETIKGYFSSGDVKPCVLVSRRVAFDALDQALNATNSAGRVRSAPAVSAAPAMTPPAPMMPPPAALRHKAERVNLVRAELEVGSWFNDWRDYACYDGVLLAADEWGGVPADVREALTRYAECGGSVYFLGSAPAPAGWEQAGRIRGYPLTTRLVGFGRWVELLVTRGDELTEGQCDQLVALMERNQCTNGDVSEELGKFIVVPNVRIPVGGVSLCILLFVILAGPVNLFFVIRRRRRIWLLWTTPLLGVLFAAVLVVYFFASEGLTRHGRARALTILNESARRAVTLGVDGVYCPIPPSEGLRYGADWELTWNSSALERLGRRRTLDLTSAQHLQAGWVSARVPFALALRGNRHAAERLPVTVAANGTVTAVNGLGAKLQRLVVRTADGRWFQAAQVAPGAAARLTAAAGTPTRDQEARAGLFQRGAWINERHNLDERMLAPGQYLAELDQAVFLQKGLGRAAYKETQWVLGLSAGAAAETKGGGR